MQLHLPGCVQSKLNPLGGEKNKNKKNTMSYADWPVEETYKMLCYQILILFF